MIFFDPSLGQAGPEMLSYPPVHNTTSNPMKIAIPKEIKKQEYRVGLLPSVAYQLVQQGHADGRPRRSVRRGRPGGEGQGTVAGGVRPDAVRPGAVHLLSPRCQPRTHRCRLPLRRHRAGLRDDRGQGPPAIARADERDRRAHVGAGRRLLFSPPLRRSRHSARRRAGRAAGPRDGARRRCGRC